MPQPSPLTQVRERLLASASRLFSRTAPAASHAPDAFVLSTTTSTWASEAPSKKASATGPLIAFDTYRRPVWTPRDYASLANEGFMQNAIVYRSVRMIAEAVASVPFLLYAGEDEIAEHPLLRLVSRPNPFQTGPELIEAFVGHLLVSGNAYLEAVSIEGDLRELHALRPDRMKIIPGADGWPEAWEYTVAGRSVRIAAEPAPGVRPILHLKQFHATNDHYGLSPLEAAASAIDLHNTASQWNKALLDNAARPSGALVYTARDGNMTAEQYERLKSELENGFQGSANAGRPLLLEGGLDWKSMSLSPKDMDFIEARHVAAREIALALGVPPMLLGIPGDNTYANLAEAQRIFWRQTVLPLVNRLASALTHWLSPAFAPEVSGLRPDTEAQPLRLVPDLDSLEALSSEREALRASLEKTSFLTTDEKRAAIGYGPMSSPATSAAKHNPWHILAGNGRESGRFTFAPDGEGGDGNLVSRDVLPISDKPNREDALPRARFYSPDRFGWHDYNVGPNQICSAEFRCSAEEIADHLSRFAVPGQDPSRPVQSGERHLVVDPRTGLPGGYVRTWISTDGLTITNVTEWQHLLHDGQIVRRAIQNNDGSWSIVTRGLGNNMLPGMSVINQWQGPEIFATLDAFLSNNIERHRGRK